MVSKWTLAIFGFLFQVSAIEKSTLKSTVEWSVLEYEDACLKVANSTWKFLRNPTNQSLQTWESAQLEYDFLKQNERNMTNSSFDEESEDILTQRIRLLLQKPGDAMLDAENLKNLNHFIGTVELMKNQPENSRKLSQGGVENLLSRSGGEREKLGVWSSWHNHLAPLQKNFSKILSLVNEAAKLNGEEDARTYWEMLSEYPDGYENLKSQWEEISNLHKMLLTLVSDRLSTKYKIPLNKTLPAHLLGSLQGHDWTNLVTDVIPHTDQIFKIKENMWQKNLLGQTLYKIASEMGGIILKTSPDASFWESSEFNKTCPTKIVNFCRDGKMRVFSCYEASLSNYITAHKNLGRVLFNQLASRSSNPIFQISNRYSVLEESFAEYFGLMAMSPYWLQTIGLIKKENWKSDENLEEEFKMISMMITALDILPRLAYYVSVDIWRLEIFEKKITDPRELAQSWWKHRLEYEGITTESQEIPTFLNDEMITSNKPYLSKFAGTLLAFQFYNQFHSGLELKFSPIGANHILAKIAVNSSQENWLELVNKITENEIDEISFYPLSSFFSFLETETEKLDFQIPVERQNEFEKQEMIYREKALIPTTTTTTSTTTTTTTTKKPITKKGKKSVSVEISTTTKGPPTEAMITKNLNLEISETESKEEDIPKPTNKAVYAVGAVLVATILVCIIAIFGRRRCTKAPKNRRYV